MNGTQSAKELATKKRKKKRKTDLGICPVSVNHMSYQVLNIDDYFL